MKLITWNLHLFVHDEAGYMLLSDEDWEKTKAKCNKGLKANIGENGFEPFVLGFGYEELEIVSEDAYWEMFNVDDISEEAAKVIITHLGSFGGTGHNLLDFH